MGSVLLVTYGSVHAAGCRVQVGLNSSSVPPLPLRQGADSVSCTFTCGMGVVGIRLRERDGAEDDDAVRDPMVVRDSQPPPIAL